MKRTTMKKVVAAKEKAAKAAEPSATAVVQEGGDPATPAPEAPQEATETAREAVGYPSPKRKATGAVAREPQGTLGETDLTSDPRLLGLLTDWETTKRAVAASGIAHKANKDAIAARFPIEQFLNQVIRCGPFVITPRMKAGRDVSFSSQPHYVVSVKADKEEGSRRSPRAHQPAGRDAAMAGGA